MTSPVCCRLFPVREIGTNWHAQDLQKREIKVSLLSSVVMISYGLLCLQTITNDWQAHNRVLTSYEMMLDFYGMRLKDHARGVCVGVGGIQVKCTGCMGDSSLS